MRRHLGETAAVIGVGSSVGELLREGGALAQDGSFPVDDVDGDDEDEGDAEEDRAGVFDVHAFGGADVWGEMLVRWWGMERVGCHLLVKKGVAGMVRTPARKSRDQPFPPVADAEYGP